MGRQSLSDESGLRRRLAALAGSTTKALRARIIDEIHRRALGDAACNLLCVPIGEPHASVRCGLGYFAWVRRAMDAVTLCREIDPHRAHRIVRTRLDLEGLPRVHALKVIRGIVSIGRVVVDRGYLEGAGRRGLLLAADGRGIKADQCV